MTDTTARRMTVAEIALMRAVVAWRRANGVTYWKAARILGRFAQWSESGRDGRQVSVDFYRGDDAPYAQMVVGRRQEFYGMKVGDGYNVTEAIDILVSIGYLPKRFSSAYRVGWDAAGRVLDAPNSEIADVEYALQPLGR